MSALHALATRALHVLDPEDAHTLAIRALAAGFGPGAPAPDPILATEFAGLKVPSPIGLAPGFDKNAEVFGPMLRAGFGFVECGTVTPKPQTGNPRPRLFRLTEDCGVINRMGFNNNGVAPFAGRLERGGPGIVGANIGANKDSADRIQDYVTCLMRLWGLASYFTINISSPNTPGLRALQTKAALEELLGRIAQVAAALPPAGRVPLFLKVAPDLDDAEIEAIVEAVVAQGLAGIIVSNTTLSRPSLVSRHRDEAGGLSGAPLAPLAAEKLKAFAQASAGRLVLIAAGGIASGSQAYAALRAGASAVQLYSAMVFEGPGIAVRIGRELARILQAEGFRSVGEAVGEH